MPPKAKFTREEIVNCALEIVRKKGTERLTARSLGAALKSSPRPIFTVFSSMDEVLSEVIAAARKRYEKFLDEGMATAKPFRGAGTSYIRFAEEEPKLFQLLFMTERESTTSVNGILPVIDRYYDKIVESVESEYGFSRADADKLYRHMWIYSHGIATLVATNVCTFKEGEAGEFLDKVCRALIKDLKL